jgi:Leucine-rich repeat (LRR) protein
MGYVPKIDLSSCELTGSIPSDVFPMLSGLKEIHLRDEAYKGLSGLQGSLSSDLSMCTSLEVIDLNSNNLKGDFPSLTKLANLKTVDVHYNRFSGALPHIAAHAMNYISFAGNEFVGTIPSSWASLKTVTILGLANNRLEGSADIIASFPKLLVVFLRNNSFTGKIPKLPTSTAVADFDHNRFSSIAADICSPDAPPAFGNPCGCTSDYPSQPFGTCCFANNSFGQPEKACLRNCFDQRPCRH